MSAFFTEFWSDFTQIENLVGHIAYVLLIISMMMRSMNWLRFFAIMAGALSSTYYWILGDHVSMFWEALFSLVNLGQFVILKIENRPSQFSDEENYFISNCLEGVEQIHTRKLMKLATWVEVEEGATLISQNEQPTHLQYIIKGRANINRDEELLGTAKRGEFIGEMSFLTKQPASASVITREPTRYLAFPCDLLREYLKKTPQVRHALEASFNRDLVSKLATRGGKPLQE